MNPTHVSSEATLLVTPAALSQPPRRAELTFRSKCGRCALAPLLLLIPGYVALVCWNHAGDMSDLAQQGRSTEGRVINRYVEKDSDGIVLSYGVRYGFEVDGRTYGGDDHVGAGDYAALPAGAPCTVTYLPIQPEKHCLGAPAARMQQDFTTAMVLLPIVIIVIGGVWRFLESGLRKELQLAGHGAAVAGSVTEKWTVRTGSTLRYAIQYRFDPDDSAAELASAYIPKGIWDRLLISDPLTVLYDPKRPNQSKPLCAFQYVAVSALLSEEGLSTLKDAALP